MRGRGRDRVDACKVGEGRRGRGRRGVGVASTHQLELTSDDSEDAADDVGSTWWRLRRGWEVQGDSASMLGQASVEICAAAFAHGSKGPDRRPLHRPRAVAAADLLAPPLSALAAVARS